MGLMIATAGFAGCSMGRVGPGAVQERYVVDGSGPDREAARRQAVAAFFDAYLSTGTRAASTDVLERSILSNTTSYIVRDRVLSSKKATVRDRCLIDYLKLGRDLEAAGLVKPQGVAGSPRAAVALQSREAGQALAGALSARGYDVVLLPAGATAGQARERGAAFLVEGEADAAPVQAEALSGFAQSRAEASLKVYALSKGEIVEDVTAEASAVDLDSATARSKALDNCGLLASDKLEKFLRTQYVERDEISVVILGLGKLQDIEKLLAAVRGARGVAGAALGAMGGGDSRLRVFVERTSPDELAAEFLRLPGYSFTVRSVEPGLKAIELDTSGEAPF